MKRIALQDAKARFGDVVAKLGEAATVITRNGREAAVLVPLRGAKGAKIVQGRRGATQLHEALRAAPGELKLKRLRGGFRPADL